MTDQRAPFHHVYDDIVEEDNHLPAWWLATLFGAIIFGFGYWFVFQVTRSEPSPLEAYRAEEAALKKQQQASGPASDQTLLALSKDQAALAEGEQIFKTTCVACHGPNGEGLVGPNLTDHFWLHGGSPAAIHASITHGYPDKGMVPWGQVLGDARVIKVTAWVVAQRNKNLPGKAPQGTEEP